MADDGFEKFEAILTQEVDPLLNGRVFTASLEELADADSLAAVFAILQMLEKEVEARKEVIRERLLHKAEKLGKTGDKGGQSLVTKFGYVFRERRESKLPQESPLRLLLAENNLKLEDAFSEQRTLVIDPSKLEQLVGRGDIPAGKLEDCKKISWALKFKPSRAVVDILELDEEAE